MSVPWFHVPSVPEPGAHVALDRDEARHALGVRRLGAGDGVTVFDGRGSVAEAAIEPGRARDGSTLVRVRAVRRVPRAGVDLVVGVAPPKGDRLSTMLDMLGQLGAAAIVPLDARFGVVDAGGINRARAERILLEAAKQSRSAWVAELRPAATLPAFVEAARVEGRSVLLADAGGGPADAVPSARAAIAVGPEGGFAPEEVDAAVAAGAVRVGLGPSVLRVETAAVALAALLRARPAAE
jgi:16S rRNA (uracil1498-N3)-methyltransferase